MCHPIANHFDDAGAFGAKRAWQGCLIQACWCMKSISQRSSGARGVDCANWKKRVVQYDDLGNPV